MKRTTNEILLDAFFIGGVNVSIIFTMNILYPNLNLLLAHFCSSTFTHVLYHFFRKCYRDESSLLVP